MEIQNLIEAVNNISERLVKVEASNKIILDLLIKKCDEAVNNISERLVKVEESNKIILDLLIKKCDEAVGTKKKAAKFIDYDEQTITKLLDEGRITNYGRGRLFIFHKSELLDLREVRIEKN